ncbi:GNAT family N-acetyltransferase [Streptomyces sp. 8L]|uniref:GNAT family N-acetyltransferase n=1 Tax=Streptomyces sp. 8L TaxID=2877242 RepID=UPI001CD5AB54|nr:GNAT family N-acetyltransferase [Streptomyces sp. 8L]MCA1222521.1 GNAT family N-acetyltransferase [Streptomyces sp. 8L]
MDRVDTERLILRPFAEKDFDDLHDIQRRPEVTRYLLWSARTAQETRESLTARVGQSELAAEGDNLNIAVELRETGRVIGDFNLLWLSEELMRAEIGFVLNPDHAGRGYATEAAREVLRIAFETYGFHRVIGRCDGGNHASMRLMERSGMRREALFVEGEMLKGERADLAVYAILGREWRAARGGREAATPPVPPV